MSDQTITEQPTAQGAPDATPAVEQARPAPEVTEQSTPAPAVEEQDTPPAEPAEKPETPNEDQDNTPDGDTEEDTRDPRVTKARAEAAKYRHRARDAETALTAVTAERDEALAKLATIEHDRMATDACRAAHLPESMASRLTGTTADDLTADARAISEAMGYDRGPVDPSQGRGTGGDSGTGPDGQTTWADVLGTGNHDL